MKRVLLALAVAGVLFASDAGATGNIKPGVGVAATRVSLMNCQWDTTITVTASTLDTLVAPCWVRYVIITSQTVGGGFASRAIGGSKEVDVASNHRGGPWLQVDTELTTWAVGDTELGFQRIYSSTDRLFKAVIIDGTENATLHISFEQ